MPLIHHQGKQSSQYMVCFHGNADHVSRFINNTTLLSDSGQRPFMDHYIASSPPEANFFDIVTGKFNEQTIIDSCVATLRYMSDIHNMTHNDPKLNLTLVGHSMGGAVALAGLRKLSILQPDLVKHWNVTMICDRTFKRYSNLAPDSLKIPDFFILIKSLLKHIVRFIGVDYDNEDIVSQFNNTSKNPFSSLSIQSYTTTFKLGDVTYMDTHISDKHLLKTKMRTHSIPNQVMNPKMPAEISHLQESYGTYLHNADACSAWRYKQTKI